MHGSYVWGLDSSPGTIISDYIVFGLCLVYGLCILHLYRSSKWNGTRLCKKSEVKVAIQLYALGKDFDKARTFLLVLTSTFLLCATMNAVGALLHHFVPLVEPAHLQTDILQTSESVNIDLWEFILSKLFPWVLVWQFANISAVLYGIGIFLTVLYTVDFHISTKYYAYQKSVLKQSGNLLNRFNYVKKILLVTALLTVIFHGVSRFQRIFEFRSVIFQRPTIEINVANFDTTKMNLDQFGWIWSGTSATIIMFSAFLVNALISLYMLIKAMSAKVASNVDFGGVKTSFVRTLGAWLLLIGGIIQILWAGTCGNNSPHDCPFPVWFNHNAWYHLLQGSGMTSWFLAEWTYFKRNSVVTKNA